MHGDKSRINADARPDGPDGTMNIPTCTFIEESVNQMGYGVRYTLKSRHALHWTTLKESRQFSESMLKIN